MGFKRNVERERLIYRYWRLGYTVDRISRLTGIPRSSVGYYVRKFNKKYGESVRLRRKLRPILTGVDESPKMSEDKFIESAILKMEDTKICFHRF